MAYTPGPWTIKESMRHPIFYIIGQGLTIVTTTYGEGDYYNTQQANARLIAAAPELLEALYKIAELSRPNLSRLSSEQLSKVLKIARAAIAQAEEVTE